MVIAPLRVCAQGVSGFERFYSQAGAPDFVELLPDSSATVNLLIPDSVFFARSEQAIFKVNKWDLDMLSPLVRRIENEVLPKARREGWTLVGVSVRGAASPEGPLRWNVTLSHRRAEALKDYLRERFSLQYNISDTTTNYTPEDYPFLHIMMRQSGDPDADRVGVAILMNDGDPVRIKRELMRMDDGRLWRRIYKTYYPQLRAARVMLFFKTPPHPILNKVSVPVKAEVRAELPALEPIVFPRSPRQHALAVRTNLLYDFLYMPRYGWAPTIDVQLEFYPRRGHWTLNAGVSAAYWHRWSECKFWQLRHYTLGARYYFKPEGQGRLTHTGLFVGGNLMANIYGIGFDDKTGWEGEGAGGELIGGYVLPLSRNNRWRLEFVLGLGLYWSQYDPYVYGNPKTEERDGLYYYDYQGLSADFKKRGHRLWWLGPTQVGINLTYDLLFWKRK